MTVRVVTARTTARVATAKPQASPATAGAAVVAATAIVIARAAAVRAAIVRAMTVRAMTVRATTVKATTGKAMTARVAIVRVASVKAAAKSSRGSGSRSRSTACSTCATRATASCASSGYLAGRDDVYVSASSRCGSSACARATTSRAPAAPAGRNEKNPALLRDRHGQRHRPRRGRAAARGSRTSRRCSPTRSCASSSPTTRANMTGRIIDLISPIGKGQRGLIVSPPKAGKTTIMKQIVYVDRAQQPRGARSWCCSSTSGPKRSPTCAATCCSGEVVASTFDRPSDEHTHVAELAIERAKRLVEMGKDVVDHPRRHHPPRPGLQPRRAGDRAASCPAASTPARCTRRRSSSVRPATSRRAARSRSSPPRSSRPSSKMDEVIFEEFKGTGNMELRLDRRLAERRIYPAIDVDAVEHPPRGAAVRPQAAPAGVEAAPGAVGPGRRRQRRRRASSC